MPFATSPFGPFAPSIPQPASSSIDRARSKASCMALLLLLKLVASLLLLHLPGPASADCEPAACGTLTLRYPFWLGSGNQTSSPCGHPAFEVWCSDGGGVAALKGSSIHVLAIDYANSSFLASHSRVSAGDYGVCRTDFNMSVSIALSPFTISPRNRALCFLSKCDGTAPSGDEFVNATSNCSAPIYAYLGGTYYWDRPPAIATGRCTYSYIPVLGREAAAMTAANYSRLLKDGFVLEWEAGGVGDCRACNASGGQCRYDNAAAAFRCLCPDGRRAAGPKCAGESLAPTCGLQVALLKLVSAGHNFLIHCIMRIICGAAVAQIVIAVALPSESSGLTWRFPCFLSPFALRVVLSGLFHQSW